MPNWITTRVKFHNANILDFPLLKETENGEFKVDFELYCPMPKALEDPRASKDELDLLSLVSKAVEIPIKEIARLKELYGQSDWYSWRVSNWGTKWNPKTIECQPEKNTCTIESAWDAPIIFFQNLSKLNKDATIQMDVISEDSGAVPLQYHIKNGDIVDLYYLHPKYTRKFMYGCLTNKEFKELTGLTPKNDENWEKYHARKLYNEVLKTTFNNSRDKIYEYEKKVALYCRIKKIELSDLLVQIAYNPSAFPEFSELQWIPFSSITNHHA